MHGSYFEAIIQVRPRKTKVEKFIEHFFHDTDKARIAKKKVFKEGVDYYISSWKLAESLGYTLVKRFGGRLTSTKSIFGKSRKTGKVVHRGTVLYRSPAYSVGDILANHHKILRVSSVRKKIIGMNLISNKKQQVDVKEGWEKLQPQTAIVSRVSPRFEVISPEDYQSIAVENPKETTKTKVNIVLYNDKVYLV